MRKIFLLLLIFVLLSISGCSSDVSAISENVENLQREVTNLRTQVGQLQTVVEDSAEKDTVYPFILMISDVSVIEGVVGITGTRIDRFGNTEEYAFSSKNSPDTAVTLNGELVGWEDLSVGDVISLTYFGGILESAPAQFDAPITAIKIIGRVK